MFCFLTFFVVATLLLLFPFTFLPRFTFDWIVGFFLRATKPISDSNSIYHSMAFEKEKNRLIRFKLLYELVVKINRFFFHFQFDTWEWEPLSFIWFMNSVKEFRCKQNNRQKKINNFRLWSKSTHWIRTTLGNWSLKVRQVIISLRWF